eukprot:gene19100-21016_t
MQSPILTLSILLTVVVLISMIDGGHSTLAANCCNQKGPPGVRKMCCSPNKINNGKKKEILGYLCQDLTQRECLKLVNEWMEEEMKKKWQGDEKEDMTKYEDRSAKPSRLIVALRNLRKKEEYKESTYENI